MCKWQHETFMKLVQAKRKEEGITQAGMAELLGIDEKTYQGFESRGRGSKDIYRISKIMGILGFSVYELLTCWGISKSDISITQAGMAELLGIDEKTYQGFESRGTGSKGIDRILKIIGILAFFVYELLTCLCESEPDISIGDELNVGRLSKEDLLELIRILKKLRPH